MESFVSLLKNAHDLLIKNPDVIEIFNVDDDKNGDESFYGHEEYTKIDWQKLLNCFRETLKYLIDYAIKNDDSDDYQIDLSQTIYDLFEIVVESKGGFSLSQLNRGQKLMLFKTHTLLLMFSVTATITKDISKLIDRELNLNYESSKESYFRGHSDEKFKLIPSIFRSYEVSKYGQIFNRDTLYKLYTEPELISKYNSVFDFSEIDGEFCAFMQHACSYSPFLDLTKNHIVALSFATYNYGNLNDYFQKKATVYEFKFNRVELEKTPNLYSMWVYFSKNRLRYFTRYQNNPIYYCTPNNFDPKLCLLEAKTNDRMKYQNGSFLFFQSCVVVNGHILMPYKIGKIIKYTINGNKRSGFNKSTIYQTITNNYRYLDYSHLMNPYLYFSEISRK